MPHHLNSDERDRTAQLVHQGDSQKEIASALSRNPGTISRELRRNRQGDAYLAIQAHSLSVERRRDRPLTAKMDDQQINDSVREGLAQDWSPEQISGRMRRENPHDSGKRVSPQTIYAWIEQDEHRDYWKSHLRRRGKRCKRRTNNEETDGDARLSDRPEEINQRLRIGDWEGDTILGPPGTGGVVTLVDRKSRYTIITKIQSKNADHVHARIKRRLRELLHDQCRSITFDNGTEFARCHRLEKHLGMELYFADPGCPYQRGTNENTNGLIRQYFPKGTDFRNISHSEVGRIENLINSRPRDCLGFRTPNEDFHEKP